MIANSYFIKYGFLFLLTFVNFRWHLRRVVSWGFHSKASKALESGRWFVALSSLPLSRCFSHAIGFHSVYQMFRMRRRQRQNLIKCFHFDLLLRVVEYLQFIAPAQGTSSDCSYYNANCWQSHWIYKSLCVNFAYPVGLIVHMLSGEL